MYLTRGKTRSEDAQGEQSLASGFETRCTQAASALSNEVFASGRSSPHLEVEVLCHVVGAAAGQVQRSLLEQRQPNALRTRRHRLDRRRRLLAQLPLPEQIYAQKRLRRDT